MSKSNNQEKQEEIIISRPLSKSEHFFRSRTATKCFNSFQVTAIYNQNLKKNLNLFFNALRKTIIDYHISVSNVQLDSKLNSFVFHPLNSVKLGDVLEFLNPDDYITNGRINENFMKYVNDTTIFELYSQKPLFRLILVGENTLSCSFEHTIADGIVTNYFHEILVENLAFVEKQSNWDILESEYGCYKDATVTLDSELFTFSKDKKYIKNSLPPPVDLFMEDIELDYTHGDPDYHEKIIPKKYPTKWKGRFPAKFTKDIAFKLINFTPEETKQILKKCKENKVSLTSYIQIIHALTMQPVFGDKNYTTHRCAMALRRHFDSSKAPIEYKKILDDPNYKIFGTSASMGFSNNLPPIKEFSWDLVTQANKIIVDGCNNKRALNALKPFLDKADPTDYKNEELFYSQLDKAKADAVKISNLGLIKTPTYKSDNPEKNWQIKDMIFSQDMAPYASDFMLSVVSTLPGGLNFVLSYFDYSFDDFEGYDNFDHLIESLHDNMIKYSLEVN
ncbi:ATF1 [Candida jiufengensis]|uniref:ATF1 n=1 Tax=Candida jiufengensis TaxID=497108 RepID=UPI0022259B59|nr:ATF1 [Candida jiufengensis]KAI5952848.1 ATF1 [Candida jiufengensis]